MLSHFAIEFGTPPRDSASRAIPTTRIKPRNGLENATYSDSRLPKIVMMFSCGYSFNYEVTNTATLPGLLGHDEIHKMVKFALRNPKLEFRNPKQIQNLNFQITKMRRLYAGAF